MLKGAIRKVGLSLLGFGSPKKEDKTKRLKQILDQSGAHTWGHETASAEMDAALGHLVSKRFFPGVVLDIGAGKGYWSRRARKFFRDAEFFMLDPLAENEESLRSLCEEDPRCHYMLLAAGEEAKDHYVNMTPDCDGSSLLEYYGDSQSSSRRLVRVTTVDDLLFSKQITPPELVKIDVQGYELKVLRGGLRMFDAAEVFIIETNLFKFMPECPRVDEIVSFMAEKGFFLFDLAGSLRRPYENDLAQLDLVFVSSKSALVQSNQWADRWAGKSRYSPRVSVILCTYNPVPDLLQWALDSLEKQTFPKSDFEVIVVDNNSKPPLDQARISRNSLSVRVIREPTQGLSFARCAGISEAKGEVLVFMDDDNSFAPDYLQKAYGIAMREPEIGLFGGVAREILEAPIAEWKRRLLPFLAVRDYGADPITSRNDFWGKWEPIGAGMVARRDVAEQFVIMVEANSSAGQLGRSGKTLLSAEDSLFARIANRLGYACSYQPSLQLRHFIKASRLTSSHLARNLEGQGRSFVLLRRALGMPVDDYSLPHAIYFLVRRFLSRVNQAGFRTGFINWFWDYGFLRECRTKSRGQTEE